MIDETTLVLESIEECAFAKGAEVVIYNSSEQFLESIYIELITEDARYIFETTMLPSFGRIVLLERSHKSWYDQQIKDIKAYYKPFEATQQNKYNEYIILEDCYLLIKNSSNEVMGTLEIYLKQWNCELMRFTNRKTDKFVIRNLQPGDELQINLCDDSLKIICVCQKFVVPLQRN